MSGEESTDVLYGGRIRVIQPRRGAKVSSDSILLGEFAQPGGGRALDLCCGTGIVAFLLATLDSRVHVLGVDWSEEAIERARRGAVLNGLEGRVSFLRGDLAEPRSLPLEPNAFDLAVANPPYHPAGAGRSSPDPERRAAREEGALTLRSLLSCARRFLAPSGRLCLVYPAARLTDVILGLEAHALRPRRLRFVHPSPTTPARRVLIEAQKSYRGPLTIPPPLGTE